MAEEKEKRIDESWKDSVKKEKDASGEPEEHTHPFPQASLEVLLSGLFMECIIALGDVPNPFTKEKKADLEQAKYLIDTIAMLKEKTRGNLSKQEEDLFEGVLYELRMKFVEKNKPS